MTSLSSPETRHKMLMGEMPSWCPKDSRILISEARRPQKNPHNHGLLVSPSSLPFCHAPRRVLVLCDCPRFRKPGRKYSGQLLPRLLCRGRRILSKHMCFVSLHLPPSVEFSRPIQGPKEDQETLFIPLQLGQLSLGDEPTCSHQGALIAMVWGASWVSAFPQTPWRFYCRLEIAIPATQ